MYRVHTLSGRGNGRGTIGTVAASDRGWLHEFARVKVAGSSTRAAALHGSRVRGLIYLVNAPAGQGSAAAFFTCE